MRKFIAATLLAIALTIAPRVSAEDAQRWHPYLLVQTGSDGVALVGDVVQPDGYETEDACTERKTQMVAEFVVRGMSTLSKCSTNDEQAEIAEVDKLFGDPGEKI